MIVAIIQARMGSTRLPGKVAADVGGHPMLWQQVQRVKLAQSIDKVVVATTQRPEDQSIAKIAESAGVTCFTGNDGDVLDRVYHAAKEAGASTVVRLTGDCPLSDPSTIDEVVGHFLVHQDELDYVSSGPEWPEGFDTEVLSMAALERAWREADKGYEREHVTPYVGLSGKFRVHRVACAKNLSHLRLAVDQPEDLRVVRSIYDELLPRFGNAFGLGEIMELYDRKPEIFRPNRSIRRNDGFFASVREERKPLRHDAVPVLTKTAAVWERAVPLIPAGTQTLSKGPTQYVQGIAPKYLQKGEGSHVWDVDGNEYIDYPMGLGAISLGHQYPRVDEAISRQLKEGISFSLMHPLEVELAELLTKVIPWAGMVRFGKNGSDATTGAIRAARGITGREKVFHCGYHGWHDWYIGSTTRNKGVPQGSIDLQYSFPYNDLEATEKLFAQNKGEVAAVIMEPYVMVLPEPGYLQGLKEVVHANGALLIFDEVATGFRFCMGGIDSYLGVAPDLACFGKAMANGMPISAIVGPEKHMRVFDELFYSFTFGGECLSLAASVATIQEMQEKSVFPQAWELGARLAEGYNRMVWDMGLQDHTQCIGLAPRTALYFRDEYGNDSLLLKSLFQQEVLKRGILFAVTHCISYSHTADDIDMTLAAYYEALEVVKKAIDAGDVEPFLEGEPVKPVFRTM